MNAALAAAILTKLTAGGRVELNAEESAALPGLIERGLVSRAAIDPDAGPTMARLRGELTDARNAGRSAREAELREEILALSDRVASASGGVELHSTGDGGAYRAAGSVLGTFHLTHEGRALLGDLGPRAPRVGDLSVEQFGAAMLALRGRVEARAGRAKDVVLGLSSPEPRGAARLAAIGAAARSEHPGHLAQVLAMAYAQTANGPLTPSERWACAECAVLAVGRLEDAPAIVNDILKLRQTLFTQYAYGRSEDALDAAVMLLPWAQAERDQAIERAAQLATHLRSVTNVALPLANALLVERTRPIDQGLAARMISMFRDLSGRGASPEDAMATAAMLSLSDGDAAWLVARADALQSYLGRFSPTPLWTPAGALALLVADVPEVLDDLRLASAATQKVLLSTSGAEAIGLAIKLLLVVAALGHGNEGDAEEGLVLRPGIAAAARRLGLAGLATSLPMLLAASTAFHKPLLTAHDVALAAAPMHSSYVYGSSGYGSSGWGSSSSGWGGGRSWG